MINCQLIAVQWDILTHQVVFISEWMITRDQE